MEIIDVVIKPIGPVEPAGESNTDSKRFENLKCLTGLVDDLLFDLHKIARENKDRGEYSMSKSGKFCNDFLIYIKNEYRGEE